MWVTFFSQTGTEIVDLVNSLQRKPDLIVFNGKEIPEKILNLNIKVLVVPNRPRFSDYYFALKDCTLATFHGWLRIVPPEICQTFSGRLFNGHPGLITEFPELRGKDPQVRAFEGKYAYGGSVVHKLTAELDSGEVVTSAQCSLKDRTLEEVYASLRATSLQAWLKFFSKEN